MKKNLVKFRKKMSLVFLVIFLMIAFCFGVKFVSHSIGKSQAESNNIDLCNSILPVEDLKADWDYINNGQTIQVTVKWKTANYLGLWAQSFDDSNNICQFSYNKSSGTDNKSYSDSNYVVRVFDKNFHPIESEKVQSDMVYEGNLLENYTLNEGGKFYDYFPSTDSNKERIYRVYTYSGSKVSPYKDVRIKVDKEYLDCCQNYEEEKF